ncbi:hypothetical protein FRB99_004657 [Tulasnella sp. 403]|nr:hypothetical protein FRB99_004657 [Tulasnella sp. 403]
MADQPQDHTPRSSFTAPDDVAVEWPSGPERSMPAASHQAASRVPSPDRDSPGHLPHITTQRILPVYRPPMPELADDNPRRVIYPSQILQLLRCGYCQGQLEAPTTLRCGHTVCSPHVQLSGAEADATSGAGSVAFESRISTSPSDNSTRPANPANNLPTCPIHSCALATPSRRSSVTSTSPVAYYPPPMPLDFPAIHSSPATPSGSSGNRPSRKKVLAPRQDVTIGKILRFTIRAAHSQERGPTTNFSKGADDETDDDDDGMRPPALSSPTNDTLPTSEQSPTSSIRTKRSRSSSSPTLDPDHMSRPSGPSHPKKQLKKGKTKQVHASSTRSHPDSFPPSLVAPLALPGNNSHALAFAKGLYAELHCEICFSLLYNPVTTPCQHDLPGYSYFYEHATNKIIESLVAYAFPEALAERKTTIEEEERSLRLNTPIFVCQLSFPGLPTILHIFEPRRCLQTSRPAFGMVMPPRPNTPAHADEYGTMLEIRSVQMLPDGRSMVETRGSYRFRILEKDSLDGYTVARIARIEDCPSDVDTMLEHSVVLAGTPESSTSEPSIEELMDTCRDFYDQLKSGTAPWVVRQLNNAYGAMPTDPSTFSFWMAMV